MNYLHAAALLSVLTTGLNGVETTNLEVPWEDEARAVGLDEKEISHLRKEKLMMGREELLQCFQAYLPSYQRDGGSDKKDIVYFITSDAMLHAYAWCAQKAVLAMEQAHAHQFRQYLESALKDVSEARKVVKGDEVVLKSAMEHALYVMGVAAVVMGVEVAVEPPELKSASSRRRSVCDVPLETICQNVSDSEPGRFASWITRSSSLRAFTPEMQTWRATSGP